MTKLKRIALLYVAVLSSAALADDNVRNGNPCISGICVGDEISTLAGIKWESESYISSMKVKEDDLKSLLSKFAPSAAAEVKAAAQYLYYRTFDSQSIPKLAMVKGFCSPLGSIPLTGTFISDSGHKTQVFVDVVPGADPSIQSLRVNRIQRTYSGNYTQEQISNLSRQLEERYQGVTIKPTFGGVPDPSWNFDIFNRKLNLFAPFDKRNINFDRFMAYPGCGKPLKID